MEQMGTTKMVNDGEVPSSRMKMPIRLDAGLITSASTGFQQDIKTFLAKPYPLYYGQFTTGDTPGSFQEYPVFETILSKDIYYSKIKGHLGIRAKVSVTIQFNAERFMQGRYILAFMPLVSKTANYGYQNSQQRITQMKFNKTTVSQLPHVQFDLNCDTEATLEIPYVTPYSHYDVDTKCGEIGSFFIYPYSVLQTGSGGSTTCQYTIWTSLSDVELVAPTLPQMASGRGAMRPVASVRKKGTVSEMEQKSAGVGPIESVLTQVSKAADVVAQVPIISLVASQVSWATAIAAKAAHVFGWSKPMDIDNACRMYNTPMPYWYCTDTVDMSMPLAAVSTNTVETLPGFAGTDLDETAIDYLKTIPAFFYDITWSKDMVTQDIIFGEYLSPSEFTLPYSETTGDFYVSTPLAWVGSMFRYYRGSIRLTFKIVKTEFHSGRLLFCYQPSQLKKGGSISVQQSTYLHREILDIRLGSEFSFVIPYASIQTYRSMDDPYGRIQLSVLNELVAPDNVAPSVSIICEVSGAPDLEFAVPVLPNAGPFVPSFTQSRMEFQMDSGDPCVIDEGILANGSMFDDGMSGARFCIGEKLMSVSQLLKRSCVTFDQPGTGDGVEIVCYPYTIGTMRSIVNVISKPTNQVDWFDYIAGAFALSRGGMRIKLNQSRDTGPSGILYTRLVPINKTGAVVGTRFAISGSSSFVDTTKTPFHGLPTVLNELRKAPLEVQIPQYHRFHTRVNSEYLSGPTMGTRFNENVTPTAADQMIALEHRGANFETGHVGLSRSVADDFQLGYFTGVPPMRVIPN